ncbi:hypothetical protein [Winogradskyella helgolandensis]|uniref:hypothetical protein n=1 Tax=Winogradskyella helgolandensis TaxID=2697010 RepID=UPI0015C800AD|nr:hypothetical protein [Winogradskyella helgolandensis]
MIQFFKRIAILLSIVVLTLFLLDSLYTYIYVHPHYARSKVSWLKTLDTDSKYDYAVFGSSRVHFNFNPMLVEEKTGYKGINLGFPNSKSFEIKLMVKLFLEKHQVNTIFIQVDDHYSIDGFDPIAIVPFLPYIRDHELFKDIRSVNTEASFLYYLPFYRYMKYDAKLGFREIMMSFYKNNKYDNRLGYPLGKEKQMRERETKYKFLLEDKSNPHIEEVIKICEEKNIEIYFYTSPIYKAEGNFDVFHKNLPNYHNFSNIFVNAKLFRDPYHLNIEGTSVFTEEFIETYFKP